MSGKTALRATFTIACALAVPAAPAYAQPSSQVTAEALFREGRRLVDARRYPEACEKFSASQKLDPAVGTLLNLGRCYDKVGRTAAAWATYQEAIAVAKATGQTEREEIARERSEELEPRLPRLTIIVSPEASAAGLRVTRDRAPILPELWGVTFPVDPGEHRVEASAPRR
jgi:tetratricopeptide (TPR) repeat protein